MKKILIMAGGTGGHVIPALTIAREFQSKGVEVEWLGTQRGIENKLITKANIKLNHISITGLRGKGIKTVMLAPFKLFIAFFQAIKIIYKAKPDVVLGMGGYASGPGGVAAWFLRKPLIIHEQNSVAGLTNKLLSKIAKQTLEAFPHSFSSNTSVICVGNPVRSELLKLPEPGIRFKHQYQDNTPLKLLILGGSSGAMAINQIMPEALASVRTNHFNVWHQVGERHLSDTKKRYEQVDIDVKLSSYIDDMTAAYQWADIVICRAGALTIAELAAVGVASILIPYPYAVDDHQTKNALFYVKNGAGILINQRELSVMQLKKILNELDEDRQKLITMACFARKNRKEQAAEKIVQCCYAVRKHSL